MMKRMMIIKGTPGGGAGGRKGIQRRPPVGGGFFVLKIGPDWGIFSRANIGGKDSLRHELPHTRNPGLVRVTVLPGLGTRFGAKQASNRGIGLLGFGVLALYTTSHLNCSLTRGKMWHNRFICNLHKIVSTSKWHFFFLLHPAVLYPAGFLLLNGTVSFFCILLF